MKTRQEMIYDFMLVLAPNWYDMQQNALKNQEKISDDEIATEIWENACALATVYIETSQG